MPEHDGVEVAILPRPRVRWADVDRQLPNLAGVLRRSLGQLHAVRFPAALPEGVEEESGAAADIENAPCGPGEPLDAAGSCRVEELLERLDRAREPTARSGAEVVSGRVVAGESRRRRARRRPCEV